MYVFLRAKALLQEKDHHKPDYSEASYERRLRKIATKGVVQLFNAVAQHQKQLQANTKAAEEAKNETERKEIQSKENKTKESFFKKLKEAPKEEEEKKEQNLFSYSKGGWNAFKYFIQSIFFFSLYLINEQRMYF